MTELDRRTLIAGSTAAVVAAIPATATAAEQEQSDDVLMRKERADPNARPLMSLIYTDEYSKSFEEFLTQLQWDHDDGHMLTVIMSSRSLTEKEIHDLGRWTAYRIPTSYHNEKDAYAAGEIIKRDTRERHDAVYAAKSVPERIEYLEYRRAQHVGWRTAMQEGRLAVLPHDAIARLDVQIAEYDAMLAELRA